ncbi:MAG: phenylacetate--CoA ligase family protein [Pirellulales bacterium]
MQSPSMPSTSQSGCAGASHSWPQSCELWRWSRQQIQAWQLEQFNLQLERILPSNQFYARKLHDSGIDLKARLKDLSELSQWPMTSKAELSESSSVSGISLHQTFPAEQYSRLHRTSGTRGQPLMILDTAEDWSWWSTNWQHVLNAAQVTNHDRVFLAFSFGPFIGFWSAHQACVDRGAMVIPGGGLSTIARLEFMRTSAATVVCCTPTYALHMAEVAQAEKFPLESLSVRTLIVAGEAGGSVAEVRERISGAWQASVVDHAGATEVGPWGFGWPDRCGLHINEASFIAEVIPFHGKITKFTSETVTQTDNVDSNTQVGELVLTSLGRYGAPVLRYRTGDIVRLSRLGSFLDRCGFAWLPEGAIGRADDMVTIRGVNIFPSSIDGLIRSVSAEAEYQVLVTRQDHSISLASKSNLALRSAEQIEKLLALRTGLRIQVVSAPHGSLPRSEAKSSRWKDQRR